METTSETSILEPFLAAHPSIKYIRYQWIDYAGILRTRILPVAQCRRLAASSSPVAMSPVAMTAATLNEFMPDLVPTGVDLLFPDFSSLRSCHYAPGHASLMCFVSEGIGNVGFERCPRTILKKICENASEIGVEFKVGFEIEFRTFKTDGSVVEECIKGFSTAAGLRNTSFSIVENVVELLETAGIEVHQFHTEGAAGMFEISTGPMSPLQAVDAWVYTRECIKTLFARQGLLATMHPSPATEHSGVGTHFHLSMTPSTRHLADSFLAGMLAKLPALCAFALPLEESYRRVNEFRSEVGAWVAWGTQNRDVPIRKIESARWEVRCCDGAANLYLAVAAFIGSGLEGLQKEMKLESRDFFGCPGSTTAEVLESMGIVRRLPTTLLQSLEALVPTDFQHFEMEASARMYKKIKTLEFESLRKISEKQKIHVLTRHF
jgi:glutamine synthetase